MGAAGGIGEGLGAEGLARQVQSEDRTVPKKPAQRRPKQTEEQKAKKKREALLQPFRNDSIMGPPPPGRVVSRGPIRP